MPSPTLPPPEIVGPFEELCAYCETMYGVFLDSKNGAIRYRESLEETLRQDLREGMTREQSRKTIVRHRLGTTPPRLPNEEPIGNIMDRIALRGHNEIYFGNMIVAAIYSMWEHHTRQRIAKLCNIDANEVRYPMFNDLRHFRNLILKNRAVADTRVMRCEVFKWFNPGEAIEFDGDRLYQLMSAIRQFKGVLPMLSKGLRELQSRSPQ